MYEVEKVQLHVAANTWHQATHAAKQYVAVLIKEIGPQDVKGHKGTLSRVFRLAVVKVQLYVAANTGHQATHASGQYSSRPH
jgi:hypothetical protein